MNPLFALLRIACGTADTLPRPLSDDEWAKALNMARKQSLVGMGFVALQSLEPEYCPSKDMCREWLKSAEPIRKCNRRAEVRSAELDSILTEAGFRPCILKGRSLADYYGDIADFRESGDIDVWVDGSIADIVSFCEERGIKYKATAAHVECDMFPDVPVEIHPQPAILRCPWLNGRLKKWFASFDVASFERRNGFTVPPDEFNLVYMPVHILHHLLFEGVGLRQLMDYFFVLRSVNPDVVGAEYERALHSLRLTKVTRGVMWIMKEVFGLDESHLLIEPDARVGAFLLDEVMISGNFGKYDRRNHLVHSRIRIARAWGGIVRNARFFSIAPEIVICNPFWRLWHSVWRRRKGY